MRLAGGGEPAGERNAEADLDRLLGMQGATELKTPAAPTASVTKPRAPEHGVLLVH